MNNAVFRISLDIHEVNSQVTLHVKKGDSARSILATLTEAGRPYAISDDCMAVFTAKKPDGSILYNGCTIVRNRIQHNMTPQTCSVAGTMNCELRLYGLGGTLITSPRFVILVDDTVYSDGDVIDSSSEFSALTELITNAQALIKDYEAGLEDLGGLATKAALEELAAFVGEPEALNTAEKENLVAAVNELQGLLARCRPPVAVYGEAPVDGLHYEAAVSGLVVESGLEILLTVASTNQGPCDLSINGGDPYPLCYRPGYFTGSNYLRPELRMPLEAEMLLRGAEYVFRFDGYSWILQSFLALPDEGGCEIPAQDEEPEAEDGALWIDTDAEPESAGYVTTEVLAAALEAADETQKAYTDGAIAAALAGIGVAEEGAY